MSEIKSRLTLAIAGFRKGISGAKNSLRSLSRSGNRSGNALKRGLLNGMRGIASSVSRMGNRIGGSLTRGIVSGILIADVIKAIAGGLRKGIASALRAVWNTVAESVKQAMSTERFLMRFEVITGDRGEGIAVFDELRAKALATGVAVQDMAENVGKFMAFGFDKEKALALNEGILDVGGAVGLTTRDMKLLGVALSQVAAKGVANMEELRQQIAEKGIPIFDALQDKLGVTGAQLSKMIKDGQVSSDDVIDLFTNLDQGFFSKFKGGAERMASTFEGQVNTLRTSWQEFMRVMGEPIRDALRPFLDHAKGFINDLRSKSGEIGTFIADAATQVAAVVETFANMDFTTMGERLKGVWADTTTYLTEILGRASVGIAEMLGEKFGEIFPGMLNDLRVLLSAILGFGKLLGMEIYKGLKEGLTKGSERLGDKLGRNSVFNNKDRLEREMTDGMSMEKRLHMEKMEKEGKFDAINQEVSKIASPKSTLENLIDAARKGMGVAVDGGGTKVKMGDKLSNFLDEIQKNFILLRQQREKVTNADKNLGVGLAVAGGGATGGPRGLGAAINGGISQAVNTLANRSASEVVDRESQKNAALTVKNTSQTAENTKKMLSLMEKNKGGRVPHKDRGGRGPALFG